MNPKNVLIFPKEKYLIAMKKILAPHILLNQLRYSSNLSFSNTSECSVLLLNNQVYACGFVLRGFLGDSSIVAWGNQQLYAEPMNYYLLCLVTHILDWFFNAWLNFDKMIKYIFWISKPAKVSPWKTVTSWRSDFLQSMDQGILIHCLMLYWLIFRI